MLLREVADTWQLTRQAFFGVLSLICVRPDCYDVSRIRARMRLRGAGKGTRPAV